MLTFFLMFVIQAHRLYIVAPIVGGGLGALAYQFVCAEERRPAELSVARDAKGEVA